MLRHSHIQWFHLLSHEMPKNIPFNFAPFIHISSYLFDLQVGYPIATCWLHPRRGPYWLSPAPWNTRRAMGRMADRRCRSWRCWKATRMIFLHWTLTGHFKWYTHTCVCICIYDYMIIYIYICVYIYTYVIYIYIYISLSLSRSMSVCT